MNLLLVFETKILMGKRVVLLFMKEYSNKTVIDSLGLPMMTCFDDLTERLRLSPKLVYWLTSDFPSRYHEFKIPKRDGSYRNISAPVFSLKTVQRWVLNNILYKIKTSPYSYGFSKGEKGSPLVRCAEKHRNNLYILKIDIKSFYPSIKREKVYNEFTNIGYNSIVANLLTNLCVYKESLPQGAVTSAYLANIICRNMDFRIAGFCNRRDIVFTRYADDMIFSSDNRDVLKSIYGTIRKILVSEGFTLNEDKTSFLSPRCRKRILGITVNDGSIKAPKEIKRIIRSLIYNSFLSRDYSANSRIRGYISYINSIEPNYNDKVKRYIYGLYNLEYTIIRELVESYNSNKFFTDMPDMKVNNVEDVAIINGNDNNVLQSYIFENYFDFLTSHGIATENTNFETFSSLDDADNNQDSPF